MNYAEAQNYLIYYLMALKQRDLLLSSVRCVIKCGRDIDLRDNPNGPKISATEISVFHLSTINIRDMGFLIFM
jgi:hypothetical protein